MNYGFGLKRTSPHELDMRTMYSAPAISPPEEYLANLHLPMRGVNQGPTSTCVAQAIRQGVYATSKLYGLGPVIMSALGLYYCARSKGFGTRITDDGCYPCDAAQVLREVGCTPDAAWPFDARRVNDEPPFEAYISAPNRRWFWLERITATGEARSHALRCAIASGRMVVKGMALDDRVFDWASEGDRPYSRVGQIIGYHAEIVPAYRRAGPVSVSSWGMPDRIDAWNYIEGADDVTDLWIVRVDESALKALAEKGVQS